MIRDKTVITLLLGLLCVLLAGKFRPPEELVMSGEDKGEVFMKKVHYNGDFDMVLAGDSRVYTALSPDIMSSSLPGTRILNFGFENAGYTGAYLASLSSLLAASSEAPSLVLGVSPHSLTMDAAKRNGYLAISGKSRFAIWRDIYIPKFLRFFDAYQIRYLWQTASGGQPVQVFQEVHADGWIAVTMKPENPELSIALFEKLMANDPVDPEIVNELFKHVRDWTNRGIAVYGYRPPTTARMESLEETTGGFDEPYFKSGFERAGGVWLTFSSADYHSYDGSHLERGAAMNFSHDLAAAIAASRKSSR